MDFGRLVLETRRSKGISQRELAKSAGISAAAVLKLEQHGAGTTDILDRILSALEVRFAGLPRSIGLRTRVKVLRTKRGWSQETLCERAGISVPALIRLEGSRSAVRIETLARCLAILAPQARVRRERVSQWIYETKDERFSNPQFLKKVRRILGRIDLDPCAHPQAFVRARRYYYEHDDGLAQPWAGRCYVNPPYSRLSHWLRKARQEWGLGHCDCIFMLLPYRLYQKVWAETILGAADIFLLIGRVEYLERTGKVTTPHGNCIVIYGADRAMIERILQHFFCVHVPKHARIGRGS
jgi:transcriptional regulator with XRE-family HTH domain